MPIAMRIQGWQSIEGSAAPKSKARMHQVFLKYWQFIDWLLKQGACASLWTLWKKCGKGGQTALSPEKPTVSFPISLLWLSTEVPISQIFEEAQSWWSQKVKLCNLVTNCEIHNIHVLTLFEFNWFQVWLFLLWYVKPSLLGVYSTPKSSPDLSWSVAATFQVKLGLSWFFAATFQAKLRNWVIG